MKPYRVETNRYSHEGSTFARLDSEHDSLPDAIDAAELLWSADHQRFVYVRHYETVDIYYKSGADCTQHRYFENGEGRLGYQEPAGVPDRPESFGSPLGV